MNDLDYLALGGYYASGLLAGKYSKKRPFAMTN
jgi:hypothetical protein